jgi:hypothetical protein
MAKTPTALLALLALPLAASLVLVGCAPTEDRDTGRDSSQSSDDDDEEEEEEADAPAEGELAEPGTEAGLNEWLTHSFTSTDDGEALISARLTGIEPLTAEQVTFVQTQFEDGKADGYDMWFLYVEEKKESGDTVEFNADYSYFDIVDEDGNQVQEITLIGWDDCQVESFTPEFDTDGAVITQCFLAAAKDGDAEPAGVAYTGGYEDDNPYSSYDGKPLYFYNK